MFTERTDSGIFEISHKFVSSPSAGLFTQHIHNYCELLLFLCGDADFNIDGTVYRPKPYDLFLIPPAVYHCLIPRSPAPYENYVINFASSLLPPAHYGKVFRRHSVKNIADDREFCRFFRRLDLYHETYDQKDFALCADALVRELLIFCSYRFENFAAVETSENPLVSEMLSLIESNLCQPLDASFLAQRLMLSKSYLQNVFSQSMHIGLKQYIAQKKVFAAQADLRAGLSSTDVCSKYGFSDYSSFYRVYRRVLGISPRDTISQGD